MKLFLRRGKILRIRPGHLANFSGGAGYMPFILIYSVPTSLLFGLVGSLLLYSQEASSSEKLEREDNNNARSKVLLGHAETGNNTAKRTPLYDFVDYARWHTVICGVLAVVVGTLFFFNGQGSVYGDKLQYIPLTLVFTAWPFVAWFLSTLLVVRLMVKDGARGVHLLVGGAAHIVLLLAGIPLLMLLSAITGTRI